MTSEHDADDSRQTHVRALALDSPIRNRYSDAVVVGRLVFVAGCAPLNDQFELVGKDDAEVQALQTFKNFERVLQASGSNVRDIVKLTIFVLDVNDYDAIASARRQAWGTVAPAGTLLQVSGFLVPGARLEVDGIAVIGSGDPPASSQHVSI